MRVVYLVLASLLVVAGCTDMPEDELGEGEHGVIVNNRIASNRIAANRIAANRIAANRIAANRIAANRFTVNQAALDDLLETPEGQELFAFLVNCALPAGVSLTADDPNGGPDLKFFGDIGVAPAWVDRPLSATDRRWVSACILSRVNENNVIVAISMRGPHTALASTAAERTSHSVEEGAFYGDIFGPVNKPLQWFACRGKGQAAGEVGSLRDRDCTEPNPLNPGFTLCGFNYAGDCADHALPRNNYACERFSASGYYVGCETAARLSSRKGHHKHDDDDADDNDDDDNDDDDDDDDDHVSKHRYDEVITIFLKP